MSLKDKWFGEDGFYCKIIVAAACLSKPIATWCKHDRGTCCSHRASTETADFLITSSVIVATAAHHSYILITLRYMILE